MSIFDFIFDLVGTIAGWAAIILGLAWAGGYWRRHEIHIYLPPRDDGGGRKRHPPPRSILRGAQNRRGD